MQVGRELAAELFWLMPCHRGGNELLQRMTMVATMIAMQTTPFTLTC